MELPMRLVILKRVYSRYLQLRQLDMDANVASTNRLPCLYFCLLRLNVLAIFSTMHRLKKFLQAYLKIYSQGYTPTPFNVTYHNSLQESCAQGSCKRVKQLMDTWTLQMGYPVLTVTKKSGNTYTVSQERFLYDRNANLTSKYKSPFK